MIGVRSLAVAILATATLALCVGAGLLRWGALGELSAVTCVLLGAVAAAGIRGPEGGSPVADPTGDAPR